MSIQAVRAAVTSGYVKDLIKIKSRQLLRRPEFKGVDAEEIRQELALHVLEQAHLFDPLRGAVVTFIAQVVDSSGAMMCRGRRRIKRGASIQPQSLEGSTILEEGEEKSLLEMLLEGDLHRHHGGDAMDDIDRCQMMEDLSGVLGQLAPDLRRVAGMIMDGASEVAISRQLGISRRQVHKAIAGIREQFENAGMGDSAPTRTARAQTA
jgi:DNA-directed RNA polymerase specialized sigma24 family protein